MEGGELCQATDFRERELRKKGIMHYSRAHTHTHTHTKVLNGIEKVF